MVNFFRVFLFILNLAILSSQSTRSIHQIQSEYYKTVPTPPVDKVSVLTGLDVLLEKKIDLITGKSIAWSLIKLVSTAMVYQTINDCWLWIIST